jgi:hypothetical protein
MVGVGEAEQARQVGLDAAGLTNVEVTPTEAFSVFPAGLSGPRGLP